MCSRYSYTKDEAKLRLRDLIVVRRCATRHEPFCLAGLWREELGTKKYTMLTTSPNESVSPYHHRMPLILRPE